MVICGNYMFEFSVRKDMKTKTKNGKKRILAHLLAYLLTLIVKVLNINVEQGKVVTTLNIINPLNIIFKCIGH